MNFTKSVRMLAATGAALAAFAFGIGQASATVFTFSFSNGYSSGNGTLVANDNGNGTFTAVSGSGTETIGGIDYLLALIFNPNGMAAATQFLTGNSGAYYTYDNQLLPSANPMLLNGGLFFSTTNNSSLVNLYSTGPGTYAYSTSAAGTGPLFIPGMVTSFELTTVPEPLSIGLLAAGLFGIGVVRRKRSQPAIA